MAWPLRSGGTFAVEPVFVSDNANLLHRAAQQGLGILLGSAESAFLPDATPLVSVLEDVVGADETVRVLSPLPMNVDPRMRAVLQGVQAFLGGR
jgi:DNA-binding transcriptional LysR family regulator